MKSRFVLKGPRPPVKATEGRNTDAMSTSNDNSTTAVSSQEKAENIGEQITEGSLLEMASQSLQFLAKLHGRYEQDAMFRPIIAKPSEFWNFKVDRQLVYLWKQGLRVHCIPKVEIQGRSTHEIVISEAHSMLAHLGANKTLDY